MDIIETERRSELVYFWAGPSQIPIEVPGVPIFSRTHLAWLSVTLFICVAASLYFFRMKKHSRIRGVRILGFILFFLEMLRLFLLAAVGDFSLSESLPLQLCDVMVFVEFYAAWHNFPSVRELCFCLGMPGALSALITPGETGYPLFNIHYLVFILIHLLLFLLPILFLVDGFKPSARRLPLCFVCLLLLAAVDYPVNLAVQGNYLFLCYPPQGSILEWIQPWAGAWYLPAMALLVWGIWGMLYGGYFLLTWLVRRRGKIGNRVPVKNT